MENFLTEHPDFLQELNSFEKFLHGIGFKRADGAIFGLLVLSARPMKSGEIQKILGLSQSAVSLSLKNLAHYGAIETREDREKNSNTKIHLAKADSLAIVAHIFRKREQPIIEEYRLGAERLIDQLYSKGLSKEDPRIKRLQSMVNTSKISEAVMKFVIELSKYENAPHYQRVVEELPRVLDLLLRGEHLASQIVAKVSDTIKSAQKNWFQSHIEERSEEGGFFEQ